MNLAQECNRIANRIQTVLEDANIKLAWVATDPLGASGRAMLKALIQGAQEVEKLAKFPDARHLGQHVLCLYRVPDHTGALAPE